MLPTPESAFEKQHNFNRDFIRSKGIKKITFDIIDKKDFEGLVIYLMNNVRPGAK